MTAAKDAVSDKVDESKHNVCHIYFLNYPTNTLLTRSSDQIRRLCQQVGMTSNYPAGTCSCELGEACCPKDYNDRANGLVGGMAVVCLYGINMKGLEAP